MSAKFPRGGSKPILSHPSIRINCVFLELLRTLRFCCKTENFTKSAQFGLKIFHSFHECPHFMVLTINNQVFGVQSCHSPFLHKTKHTRIVVVHVDKRLAVLTASGKPGNTIVPLNITNYCLGNSSVTHDIAKYRQLLVWVMINFILLSLGSYQYHTIQAKIYKIVQYVLVMVVVVRFKGLILLSLLIEHCPFFPFV